MTESYIKPLQRTGLTVSGGEGSPVSLGPSTSSRNQEVPAALGRLTPVHTALTALTEQGLQLCIASNWVRDFFFFLTKSLYSQTHFSPQGNAKSLAPHTLEKKIIKQQYHT